jgi:Predicted integral membrane protein (DUF2269)
MHITLFGFVLFLHILVAILGFMMAAIVHAGLPALARAVDVREMRSWTRVLHRIDPLFPIDALVLLLLGSWLIHLAHGRFAWSDGWVLTSVIALIVVEGLSGALLAPKAKHAIRVVADAADGAVPDEVRRAALEPMLWHVSHLASFSFAGVVLLMAAHPSGAWSVVIVIVAALIGLVASSMQLRSFRARAPATIAAAG